MKLAFIGTGNMGGAIFRAVIQKVVSDCCFLSNRSFEKTVLLASEYGANACETNTDCAWNADVVFLGVKPYSVSDVLKEIAPVLREDTLIVSMAAGVSGDTMRKALGRENPIIRIMPNTPCEIGKGLVLLAPIGDVKPEAVSMLSDLLSCCGTVFVSDESHADAAMTIGGCTPAFTYLFIEALADGAVRTGIPRKEAIEWVAQTVAGSAEMVLQTGRHPGALKDAVCSPGGSTIEGIAVLESHAFRAAAMDAIVAAFEKTKKLG